jgi:hypothetical protein
MSPRFLQIWLILILIIHFLSNSVTHITFRQFDWSMILTRSQAAAFRRNSPESESSDLNLTPEGDNQTSPQNLLSQNFSFASTARPPIKSKDKMSETNSHLTKATKISSLNKSSDWPEWNRQLMNHLLLTELWEILNDEKVEPSADDE